MPHKIAIVGAGISGLAVAALLREQKHDVTLFEKFSEAKPLGAGLVLQQTGLAVLANLGLDKSAIAQGAIIKRFLGKTAGGKTVYDLLHENLSPRYFSLGIHRHSLFQILFEKVLSLDIPVVSSFHSAAIIPEQDKYTLIALDNRRFGRFDLIIDASGTHSGIRDKYASIRFNRPFAYGALWGICEDREGFSSPVLHQRFHQSKTGIGLIPIGKRPGTGDRQHIALHWSIGHADYAAWKSRPLDHWKKEVTALCPEAKSLVAQFKEHAELTMADYREIALHRFYSGRIAFIGDACHSISPRLGQGANLALVDALALSRLLTTSASIDEALRQYDVDRKNHIRFYHRASRWMNFLFQSESMAASVVRDLSFRVMCRIPYTHRQMLMTMSGLKTGLFNAIDPGALHPDYALAPHHFCIARTARK